MDGRESAKNNPWPYISRLRRGGVTIVQIVANFIGAGICTSYFIFFEQSVPIQEIYEIIYFTVIMFVGLVVIGTYLNRRWARDLDRFDRLKKGGQEVGPDLFKSVQRKILNLPLISSLTSLFNWGLASIMVPVYLILSSHFAGRLTLRPLETFRIFVGLVISGIITSAIVFFSVEILCRRIWPYFFPDGNMVKTLGAFRLRIRTRMLVTFVLASILPMILMAVLSYNKARMMLVMDPEEVIQSLFYLTAFLLMAELAVAVTLSYLVSTSIVSPVKDMELAMSKVEKGDLTVSARAIANDELGALAENFGRMVEGLRDRERIKETFGRFVTPEIAQAILAHQPALGGENTEVSILFSDVRNYTTICEQLKPSEVISLLNDYFAYMVRSIETHQGLVYQFVGDGIMAVFGAPVKLPDHATCAVRSALEMMKALEAFNARHRAGLQPLSIGIGINSGDVVAGIIGTEQRMEYRVVGDAVNLTARIESLNKEFQTDILISRSTRDRLDQDFNLKEFPPTKVKGKEKPVQVYAVVQ